MMIDERQGRGEEKEEMSRLAALEMKEKNEKESKREKRAGHGPQDDGQLLWRRPDDGRG